MLVRSPVARIRVDAGFRIAKDAAEKLDVSRMYLLEIEAGRSKPGALLKDRMCRLYECSMKKLDAALVEAQRDLLKRQLKALDR